MPNGLIQLNEISAGKPVMFVHFVVCLFANSEEWTYFQEQSSKTSWQFACLFIVYWQVLFSVNHVLWTGTVLLAIDQRKEIEMYMNTYIPGLCLKTIHE